MTKILSRLKKLVTGNQNSEYFWNLRKKAQIKHCWWNKYRYVKYCLGFNAYIPSNCNIEGMPVFPHGINGIFISSDATIGKGCVIFHHVTIGSNSLLDSKGYGAPTLGDNVYIGAGAKIIGSVKVGNNVRIGANCVVTQDVPDNTTVIPAPVRYIIKDKPMDNKFRVLQTSSNTKHFNN